MAHKMASRHWVNLFSQDHLRQVGPHRQLDAELIPKQLYDMAIAKKQQRSGQLNSFFGFSNQSVYTTMSFFQPDDPTMFADLDTQFAGGVRQGSGCDRMVSNSI
jgi:hypothetical protein